MSKLTIAEIFERQDADDHYEYSKSTHLVNQLKDMPNRVIEAAILELEVELAERDPNFEKDMGDG